MKKITLIMVVITLNAIIFYFPMQMRIISHSRIILEKNSHVVNIHPSEFKTCLHEFKLLENETSLKTESYQQQILTNLPIHLRLIDSEPIFPEVINEFTESINKYFAYELNNARVAYIVIDKPGYYELTSDIINCTCSIGILINANNVILNGNGHILDGNCNNSSIGIFVKVAKNVTIFNITVREWSSGIIVYGSHMVTILGCSITENNQSIHAAGSTDITIYGNYITNNDIGIDIFACEKITIFENFIASNNYGVSIWSSYKVIISSNNITNNNFDGISTLSTENITILRNFIGSNNRHGLYVITVRNITISENYVENNSRFGIKICGSDGVIIVNNTLVNDGLYIVDIHNNIVSDNTVNGLPLVYYENVQGLTITNAGQIILVNCSNITIKDLEILNTDLGIELLETTNVDIVNCKIINNLYGIHLLYSSSITIKNTILLNNGIFLFDSYNNTVKNVTINGKPLVYYENTEGKIIEKAGQIILVNCRDIKIRNVKLSNVDVGIELWKTDNVEITNSNISNNQMFGIYLYLARNSIISDNYIAGNALYGIYLFNSTKNIISKNIIANNKLIGIFLYKSNQVIINENDITNNKLCGIALGIDSFGNVISENNITNNYFGVYIWVPILISIAKLTIKEIYSFINRIFFNNFINNTFHINPRAWGIWTTIFNITYMYDGKTYENKLGNYWSGYNGTDTNHDGICDEPYYDDGHPLLHPTWFYIINDSDKDGLDDIKEATYFTNPRNADTDKDNLRDGVEVMIYKTDPRDSDTDNDCLCDGAEVLVYGTDPRDNDTEGDGMPDGWEVNYNLDPLTNDSYQDLDNDGLTNLEEFHYGTDPRDPDTDNDGMPDGWEIKYDLNPLINDSMDDPDGDNLTNLDEYAHNTNPRNPDTDGDGFLDGWEVYSYTDPCNPYSNPLTFVTEITITIIIISFVLSVIFERKTKRHYVNSK